MERLDGDAFFPNVVKILSELAGERIPADAFRLDKLPNHLRMNIRVVDGDGATVQEGRDLSQLRKDLDVHPSMEVTPAGVTDSGTGNAADAAQWHRDGIDTWDFDVLPKSVPVERGA